MPRLFALRASRIITRGNMETRTPAEVFPPGELIREEIEARGWSQVELAEILGRPPRLVSEIISGKRAVTPETAKGLGAAFGTGATFWLNMEGAYQLSRTMHDDAVVERRARLYEKVPVKEMIKRGWITNSDNVAVLEAQVVQFFGLREIGDPIELPHAARRGPNYPEINAAQYAWLFRVGQIAAGMQVKRYKEAALRGALRKLSALLADPAEARHVPAILAECGVRFVLVEKLPQAAIDGVCCWLDDDSPVIGMSFRLDRIDNFWFVLRHEIEHVLLQHGRDGGVIDFALEGMAASSHDERISAEERAANAAASDFCAPAVKLNSFLSRKHPFYSEKDVLEFARITGRHPGLIVGQMQFRMQRHDYLRRHLERVRDFVLPEAVADGWGRVVAR